MKIQASITIPYAVANYAEMRDRGFYYVDKTDYIPRLEAYKAPVFLRPRRFGIIGHGIGNRYTCLNFHILSLFVTLTVTKLQKFFVLRVESGQNMK